ncbi:MAG: DUF2232 domain-containing protein [Eubacteriales bacterium]|nr:DUF2232 domain-containing protein [Eubacteriales bacterium]
MYATLALLMIIVLPLPVLVRGNRAGTSPFRSILTGAVMAGVGMAIVFLLGSIAGSGITGELENVTRDMSSRLAGNDQLAQALGMDDLGRTARIAHYQQMYAGFLQIVPASLMITAVIVSWLEGLLIGRRRGEEGRPYNPVPPLRTLIIPRSTLWGWLVIVAASWIIKLAGLSFGTTLTANVDILFSFTFALQGMSLVLQFFFLKKVPKAVPVLILIMCWLTSIGQNILFILGLIDIVFHLRGRIKAR